MTDKNYCYEPDFTVLQNRAGLRTQDGLDRFERRMVRQRIMEDIPTGDFDLDHLRAIHYHLFQDIYEWAGEIRTVELSKSDTGFLPQQFIERSVAQIHESITGQNYLRELSAGKFAERAAVIMGDVNHVHPFREGNGRTQLQFYKQLAERAGHTADLTRIDKDAWIEASIQSHDGSDALIRECLRATLPPERTQSRSRLRRR